jgi:hypothetical protein
MHEVPSASKNNSSSDDEQASTANSTKTEQPNWDPANHGSTKRKAPPVAKGVIQLLKSLLLPIVGEDIYLENEPSFSDAVLQPSRILPFATLSIIGWFQLLQITSSLAMRRRQT